LLGPPICENGTSLKTQFARRGIVHVTPANNKTIPEKYLIGVIYVLTDRHL